jgi:carboxylesterase
MRKGLRIFMIIIASLIGLALIAVAVIYFWPFTSHNLKTSKVETLTYQQAMDRIAALNQQETADGVCDTCHSKLYTHETKTAKSVVMLHGVTACPEQFTDLAQKFYDSGYNVYVPLTPHHGLPDGREHGKVTAQELVNYATQSLNITAGLGDETGAIGFSGGGVLATWAAEYRTDVKHLLVLSPFYEPASSQAPKWQLPFLYFLYGKHILPDKFVEPATPTDAAFSYSALANYGIVTKNLKSDSFAPNLTSIAVVTSDGDDQIDLALAKKIPEDIAKVESLTFRQTALPTDWHIGHNIVTPDDSAIAQKKDYLFNLYFNYYEGRDYK